MLTWEDIIEIEDVKDRREFGRMCSGITVFRQGRALIVLPPNDGFRVLSSGFYRDGFSSGPQAVVNITSMGGSPELRCMDIGLDENDRSTAAYIDRLGLNPSRTIAFNTAASMDNAVIMNTNSSDGIKVSAAVTGGIMHNGGRAGDHTDYDEAEDTARTESGTIIIILAVDASLSDGALLEAMLIATEAKSCVIQELQARSLYSEGIATGSGTDQVAVIMNRESGYRLDRLSRDSDLAKTIASCVSKSLRNALDRQSGMNCASQCDALTQLARIGVTRDRIRDEIRFPASMSELLSAMHQMEGDPYLTAITTAVMHIYDDVRNGVMAGNDGLDASRHILENVVLGEITDPVERIRFDSAETIPELLSYASALKLMSVVKERRVSDAN